MALMEVTENLYHKCFHRLSQRDDTIYHENPHPDHGLVMSAGGLIIVTANNGGRYFIDFDVIQKLELYDAP